MFILVPVSTYQDRRKMQGVAIDGALHFEAHNYDKQDENERKKKASLTEDKTREDVGK